jgi:DNA-binding Lrp family transcriptional regulator
MDLKDKKILSMLDEDASVQSSAIARKVGLSRQSVDYRINQMVEKGVIMNFVSLIDPSKFVDNIWHVYLKLQNLTPVIEKSVLNFLKRNKKVWWVAKCQGEWDLIFSVAENDILILDNLLEEFESKFGKYVNQKNVASLVKAYVFPRGYFLERKSKRNEYIMGGEKVKFDKKDLAILKMISKDARAPSTKISEKTGLTPRQVIYRIKELEKKEIIRMYRLQLDLEKIDYDYYKVCFYTQNFTKENEKEVLSWCENNFNVIFYTKKISPWTFEIEFEIESHRKLNEALVELRNKFGNVIKRTETTLILEEFKGELDILKTIF